MIRFRLDPNSAKQKYILSKALSMEMEGELMKDSRKDSKGRVLKDSESQRKDGSYEYKGADGRRHSVYAGTFGRSGNRPRKTWRMESFL